MKNPLVKVLQVAIAALVCLSCELSTTPGNTTPEPDDGTRRTTIVFNNPTEFRAEVFSLPKRDPESKIAEVKANAKSPIVSFNPQPSGYYFYPRYFVSVEGITIPVDSPANGFEAVVKENISNPINIPSLTSSAYLTQDVYLKLSNQGNSAIRLSRASIVIKDIDNEEAINSGNTGTFLVSPGKSDQYRVLIGSENFPFPEFDLEAGTVYTINFTSSVQKTGEVPIVLANASSSEGNGTTYLSVSNSSGSLIRLEDTGKTVIKDIYGNTSIYDRDAGTYLVSSGSSRQYKVYVNYYSRYLELPQFTMERGKTYYIEVGSSKIAFIRSE